VIRTLLSGDLPRSRLLAFLLVAIFVCLALAPFLFPGTRSLDVAARVCVFILLVASYDLLLGYTGIVSFAHTMFFGIGGYGVAIGIARLEPSWSAVGIGAAAAILVSLALSFVIGLFSLRVKAIFFAMITLAVASFFAILASQLSNFTGGEDGITFRVPEALRTRITAYYVVFGCSLVLFLALLRVVNSPFGRVLLAIRENDFRAEALHRPQHHARLQHHDRHPADGRDRRHGYHVRRRDRRHPFRRRAELPAGRHAAPLRRAEGRSAAARPLPPRPLAALARRAVRDLRLQISHRHRRLPAP
jgi:hypothetical protein